MALIQLTKIADYVTMSKKGTFYRLAEHIYVEASRIEILEPLTSYHLLKEDVENSNGTMDGTPTKIRTYSGYTCKVAESATYIETLMHK